jgi:ribosomal protein S18 acetylase RimI-like enzyme
MNWPADPAGWLTPPGLLQVWVAEVPRGVIAGHIALEDVTSGGKAAEVARLFVTPAARRHSVATALIAEAARWAGDHGYRLTLNVVDEQRSAAVAFYESTGWRHTHHGRLDDTRRRARPPAPLRSRRRRTRLASGGRHPRARFRTHANRRSWARSSATRPPRSPSVSYRAPELGAAESLGT